MGKQAMNQQTFWPDKSERELLGFFYLAEGISEILNVVFIFRFIYLYMVLEKPEWAVITFFVEATVVLLMEIPTGVVADRWGRKASVISGGIMYAFSLILIPYAVSHSGVSQLWAVSLCFALAGLGQTLVSGAEEAWVVDNLNSANRKDLIDRYFGRVRSFAAFGGVGAGLLAVLIMFTADVTQSTLDLLWYLAAFGILVTIAIVLRIPEYRPPQITEVNEFDEKTFFNRITHGFHIIFRSSHLTLLTIAIVIATFSGSIADEAFDISMVTKGLDVRSLAVLGILTDLIGVIAPLVGVVIARRFGASQVLIVFLILPAVLVCVFFFDPSLWMVLLIYALLAFFDYVWDPVANAKLHSMIPSASRATIGSTVNQLSGMASIGGLGLFALLLGEHSEALRSATPDLVEAFSGGVNTHMHVPTGFLGVPIPDLIIILFVITGLSAIPFLYKGRSHEVRKEYK